MSRLSSFCLNTGLFLCASLAAAPCSAADTLGLGIATDTPLKMTGAVTGHIVGTPFVRVVDQISFGNEGRYFSLDRHLFASVGVNWHIEGVFFRRIFHESNGTEIGTTYGIELTGQHWVAPDPDEIFPNRLDMTVKADNVGAVPDLVTLDSILSASKPHPTAGHRDTMVLVLDDLNDAAPGYLSVEQQFSGVFRLEHVTVVPEPQAWAMLIAGIGVVGWTVRRSRAA